MDDTPLTLDEIKRAHQIASTDPKYKDTFGGLSLQQFAQRANAVSGGSSYSAADAGPVGLALKGANDWINEKIKPVSDVTASGGKSLDKFFGTGNILEGVGRALPRSTAQTLATVGGIAMAPEAALAGGALATAGTLGTMLGTYGDTGSPAAAAASGLGGLLLPASFGAGAKLAQPISRAVGNKLGGALGGAAERGVEYAGGQLGGLVNQLGTQQAESLVQGHGWVNPFTKENVVSTLAGSLAFAPFDLPMLAKGYKGGAKGNLEPFNWVDVVSGKKPVARSLADAERQRNAVADLQTAVVGDPNVEDTSGRPGSTPETAVQSPTVPAPVEPAKTGSTREAELAKIEATRVAELAAKKATEKPAVVAMVPNVDPEPEKPTATKVTEAKDPPLDKGGRYVNGKWEADQMALPFVEPTKTEVSAQFKNDPQIAAALGAFAKESGPFQQITPEAHAELVARGMLPDAAGKLTPQKAAEVIAANPKPAEPVAPVVTPVVTKPGEKVTEPVNVAAKISSFKLPKDLEGAKPTYGYGSQQFHVEFASDFDKAAYIVQSGKAKRNADYDNLLKEINSEGFGPSVGLLVKAKLKEMAKNADVANLPKLKVGKGKELPVLRIEPIGAVEHGKMFPANGTPKPVEPVKLVGDDKKAVTAHVEKVDAITGGDIVQMAEAKKRIENLLVPVSGKPFTDVEVAKNRALKEMLLELDQKEASAEVPEQLRTLRESAPDQFYKGVNTFFTQLFTMRGYTPEQVASYTNTAMKVAIIGGMDVARLKLVISGQMGSNYVAFHRYGLWNGIMGLSRSLELSSKPFAAAFALDTFAHEVFHGMTMRPNELYSRTHAEAEKLQPTDKSDVLWSLIQSVYPIGKADKQTLSELKAFRQVREEAYGGADGTQEFLADVAGMTVIGMASPAKAEVVKNFKDYFIFSEGRMQDFMSGLFTDLSATSGALADYHKTLWGNSEDSGFKAGALQTLHDNVVDLLSANVKADQLAAVVKDVSVRTGTTPFDLQYFSLAQASQHSLPGPLGAELLPQIAELNFSAKNMVTAARNMVFGSGAEKEFGIRPGLIEKLMVPLGQRAKETPAIRPAFDLGTSFRVVGSKMANELLKPFLKPDGKLDTHLVERLQDPKNPLNGPISKLALLMNENERWFTPQEFARFAGHLSAENQTMLKDAMSRYSQANQAAAHMRVNGFEEELKARMALFVVNSAKQFPSGTLMNPAMADQIAHLFYDHAVNGQILTQFAQMTPMALQSKLLNFANEVKPQLVKLKDMLLGADWKGKPWWSSEVRMGDWVVSWKDAKGETQLVGFPTQKAATERIHELEKQGVPVSRWNRDDRADNYREMSPDLFQRYAEADKVVMEASLKVLEGSGYDQDTIDQVRQTIIPGEGIMKQITPPSLLGRKLVGGRETLNLAASNFHYITSTSYGLAKKFVKSRAAIILSQPEMIANPALRNEMRGYLDDIINMGGKEFHGLQSLVFTNYLAGNVPAMLTEPLQTYTAHVPYLIREGAGIGQAFRLATRALFDAPEYAWGEVPTKPRDPNKLVKHMDVIRALEEGVINNGLYQQVSAFEDAQRASQAALTNGGVTVAANKLVGKPLYWLLQAARNIYSITPRLNSTAAFMSAWEFATHKGISGDARYSFAKQAVQTTMDFGGRAARPQGIRMFGKGQGVAALAYSLNSYTFNVLSMMSRLGRESIKKLGLSPGEKASARKAFGTMLATQFALGGAMGLPFTGAMLALIDQFYPEAEVKRKAKEMSSHIAGLFTDDQEMGAMVSNGVMNGVLNAVGPLDVGSRFQLGSVFGINPYDGFSFENLLGPSTSMLANYVKGTGAALNGDFYGGIRNFAPAGVKGVVDLVHNDFQERDKVGKLLFDPTTTETVGHLLGFKPKRLTQYYEQQQLNKQADSVAARDLQRFHEDVAKTFNSGDLQLVRGKLLDRAANDSTYDPVVGAKRVAEIAQEQSIPVDMYRTGSMAGAQVRGEVSRAFDAQRSGVTEGALLQQRKQMETRLGIPGAGRISPSEMTFASMVDQLLQSNPKLTPMEARQVVQKALTRKPALQ